MSTPIEEAYLRQQANRIRSAEGYIRGYALKGVTEDLPDDEELPELRMPEKRIDFAEEDYTGLSDGGPDINWSLGFVALYMTWLDEFHSDVNTRPTSPQSVMVDLSNEEDLPELASRSDGSWDNDSIEEFD
jgi:hypothetical protein